MGLEMCSSLHLSRPGFDHRSAEWESYYLFVKHWEGKAVLSLVECKKAGRHAGHGPETQKKDDFIGNKHKKKEGHLNIYGMKGELLCFLETAEELIILYNPYT